MRTKHLAAIAALLLVGAAPLEGQEQTVTPTIPPAKVAAAVAEALRQAEAAAAKRHARASERPTPSRRVPAASSRRYDVRWPTQRMVVHWPAAADDHITLKWPENF